MRTQRLLAKRSFLCAAALLCGAAHSDELITQYRYRSFAGTVPPGWVSTYKPAETVLPNVVTQQRGTADDAFQDFLYAEFNGTSTVYTCDDDVADNDLSKDFSVQAFLRMNSTNGVQTVCSTLTADPFEGFRLVVSNGYAQGQVVFDNDVLHAVTAPEPLAAGVWYRLGYRLQKDTVAEVHSVDLWVNESHVVSTVVPYDYTVDHSPQDPVIGADRDGSGGKTNFLSADVYAVQIDDYGASDFFLESPAIRDGSRYFGIPSYHDYLDTGSDPLALRITETWDDTGYSAFRSRLKSRHFCPFLNDYFIPQGTAADDQAGRIFVAMYYKDVSGENPSGYPSLVAEVFMPEGRLGNVMLLHDETDSPNTTHAGGIAFWDGHLYVPAGSDLLVYPIADLPPAQFDPDRLTGFAPISIQPCARFTDIVSFDSIAFVNVHLNAGNRPVLWLGDFDGDSAKSIDVFDVTGSTNLVYSTSFTQVNEDAQGVLVYYDSGQTNRTLLSTSYGSGDSTVYQATYSSTASAAVSSRRLLVGPGGFEDFTLFKGDLWTSSESGGKHFQKRTFPWSMLFPFVFSLDIDDCLDSDTNSVPDQWQDWHGIAAGADPDSDEDGDGLTLLQEFASDTDPADPASLPLIQSQGAPLELSLPASSARFYTLECSLDLKSWSPVEGQVRRRGSDGSLSVFPSTGESTACFRFNIEAE